MEIPSTASLSYTIDSTIVLETKKDSSMNGTQ